MHAIFPVRVSALTVTVTFSFDDGLFSSPAGLAIDARDKSLKEPDAFLVLKDGWS